MKIIQGNSRHGLDLYFKDLESAQKFSNYWRTVDSHTTFISKYRVLDYSYVGEHLQDDGYLYTLNFFPDKSIVDSYLDIFPEELED